MHMMIDDKYPVMPWEAIDAVVFDVGRVLLDFQPEQILKEYLPDSPELHPALLKRVFQSPYWVMRDHGTITNDEAVWAMSGGDSVLLPAVRHIMNSWIEMKDLIPEGIDALRLCKKMGKKVYILSNYADEPFAHVAQKYDFFSLCDRIFVSSRLKMTKPDPRIYAHVTQATGHASERILFIDDAPGNIEAALEAGWQGLCYNEAGKIARFVK